MIEVEVEWQGPRLRGSGIAWMALCAAVIALLGGADPWAFTPESVGMLAVGLTGFAVQIRDVFTWIREQQAKEQEQGDGS